MAMPLSITATSTATSGVGTGSGDLTVNFPNSSGLGVPGLLVVAFVAMLVFAVVWRET